MEPMDSDFEADDSEYDYTGEESNAEDVVEEEERCRFDWREEELEGGERGEETELMSLYGEPGGPGAHCVDWEYCQRDATSRLAQVCTLSITDPGDSDIIRTMPGAQQEETAKA